MKVEGFAWDFHPECADFVQQLQSSGKWDFHEDISLKDMREASIRSIPFISGSSEKYDVTRSEVFVPSDDLQGTCITLRT